MPEFQVAEVQMGLHGTPVEGQLFWNNLDEYPQEVADAEAAVFFYMKARFPDSVVRVDAHPHYPWLRVPTVDGDQYLPCAVRLMPEDAEQVMDFDGTPTPEMEEATQDVETALQTLERALFQVPHANWQRMGMNALNVLRAKLIQ